MSYARADDDARAWLERMNEALVSRNYDGTFFHLRNDKVESMRIVHRVENGRVAERLVSLDGSGREIIRNDDELTCFFPDQRRVVVETRPTRGPLARGPLMGSLPVFNAELDQYYELKQLRPRRLLDRSTRVIAVDPKDNYRFGYRLWIDEKTAMPLKTQLCDAKGKVLEQILFAKLTLSDRMPKSAVQPQVNTEGFQWVRQQPPPPAQTAAVWHATQVPPGFKLSATSSQMAEGAKSPVSHLVYSDGLASVSVFIQAQAPSGERLKGPQRVGSVVVFSTTVKGHQVTAVGEVPVQTVRLIAHSTQPNVPTAAAER